jgi:NO-binding membrane sensor protein with MHYT domain
MNDAVQPTDSSLLLWLLAAVVAVLAAHVAQGWVYVAQRTPGLRRQWPALLASGATLGTGLCAAVLLAMSAQGLLFAIGYRALPAAGLWLGAMLGCALLAGMMAATKRAWLLLIAGTLLALLAAGVHFGWLWAAGFRPGIVWRREYAAAAVILMVVGLSAAVWLAFSDILKDSEKRTLWRLCAAALLGLGLAGGQELMIHAAGLVYQQGSVYEQQLPGAILSLVAGVLVPLVLTVMTIDLVLRRPARRRRGDSFNPQRRRKRRHRIRTL